MSAQISRRSLFAHSAIGLAAASTFLNSGALNAADEKPAPPAKRARQRIAVSTYSFWQFKHEEWRDIGNCLDAAAKWGFDGVEILHRQMTDESNATLQGIKRRAFANGVDLCGFSTHQGFLSPKEDVRKKNIDHTIKCIELAYAMGIPTMRVNTGTWGTSKDFDDLMANRGIEKPLEGYTDVDAQKWVVESLEKCLPTAEKCGVQLGLENHWGLGRTPEGVLDVVKKVNSPWLRVTMDTGNFLEDPYARLEQLAPETILVQAKTYYGGGLWYSLDLDYPRIAKMLDKYNYKGYVSLEFEGKDPPEEGIKKSLAMLTESFAWAERG